MFHRWYRVKEYQQMIPALWEIDFKVLVARFSRASQKELIKKRTGSDGYTRFYIPEKNKKEVLCFLTDYKFSDKVLESLMNNPYNF